MMEMSMRLRFPLLAMLLVPAFSQAQSTGRNIDAAMQAQMVAKLAPFKGTKVAIVQPQGAPERDMNKLHRQLQQVMKAALWDNDQETGGPYWEDAPDGYGLRVDKYTDEKCAPPVDALIAALELADLHPFTYMNGPLSDPKAPCPRIVVYIGPKP